MEKKAINFSFNVLVSKFRHAQKQNFDPNLLWKLALLGWFIGGIISVVFAYITYDWAVTVEGVKKPTHTVRDTFSPSEIKEVISLYQQKEINFKELEKNIPVAPAYKRIKPPQAPSVSPPLPEESMQSTSTTKLPTR